MSLEVAQSPFLPASVPATTGDCASGPQSPGVPPTRMGSSGSLPCRVASTADDSTICTPRSVLSSSLTPRTMLAREHSVEIKTLSAQVSALESQLRHFRQHVEEQFQREAHDRARVQNDVEILRDMLSGRDIPALGSQLDDLGLRTKALEARIAKASQDVPSDGGGSRRSSTFPTLRDVASAKDAKEQALAKGTEGMRAIVREEIREVVLQTDSFGRRCTQQQEEMGILAERIDKIIQSSSAPVKDIFPSSKIFDVAQRMDSLALAVANLDKATHEALERERQDREVVNKAMALAQESADRAESLNRLSEKLESLVDLVMPLSEDLLKDIKGALHNGYGAVPKSLGTVERITARAQPQSVKWMAPGSSAGVSNVSTSAAGYSSVTPALPEGPQGHCLTPGHLPLGMASPAMPSPRLKEFRSISPLPAEVLLTPRQPTPSTTASGGARSPLAPAQQQVLPPSPQQQLRPPQQAVAPQPMQRGELLMASAFRTASQQSPRNPLPISQVQVVVNGPPAGGVVSKCSSGMGLSLSSQGVTTLAADATFSPQFRQRSARVLQATTTTLSSQPQPQSAALPLFQGMSAPMPPGSPRLGHRIA